MSTDLLPRTAAPRTGLRAAVARSPLTSFFLLSAILSWWPGLLYLAGWSPAPMAGFGPFLAAVVVLAATGGRGAVAGLLRSMVRWRVPVRSYVAALGLPVLVSGAAIFANLALGAARPQASGWALAADIPVTMLLILLVPGLGGAWEEPGFRGFALGRLERRFGAAAGPLVLGVLWVLWHGPLFLAGQILWTDVLTIVAASVVIAAVFHSARDSVLIVMLLHATNNAVGGNFASRLFEGADDTRLGLLTAGGWWLLAAGALAYGARKRATREVRVLRPLTRPVEPWSGRAAQEASTRGSAER
jgi:membrane protease YdiL (CAAX protease family)